MSKNALRIDDLTSRTLALEAQNRELRGDIKTMLRHYETLGRNLRKVLEEFKRERLERSIRGINETPSASKRWKEK
jgi:hypothetical protein